MPCRQRKVKVGVPKNVRVRSTANCERSVMGTCLVNLASLAGDDAPRIPSIYDVEHLLEMKCLQVM